MRKRKKNIGKPYCFYLPGELRPIDRCIGHKLCLNYFRFFLQQVSIYFKYLSRTPVGMEGNKRSFFRKQSNTQFKRKGGHRKEIWNNSNREQPLEDSYPSETVYRILCHSRKIGSVIGKGGSIVKALREETQAKITVADSVAGSEERVIIIYSSSTRIPEKHSVKSNDGDLTTEKKDELMEPHCAAQVALLRVHDRIIAEDIVGGSDNEAGNGNVVTARLLVPNNMVGCLLGKKGDVIQRLRSETGANIRVLPADNIPICAMETDELVQISGKPAVARKALYQVSTLLHQNPRKDQPPAGFPNAHGSPGVHSPHHLIGKIPHGDPIWSQRNTSFHGGPQWSGRYEGEHSRFGRGGYDDFPGGYGEDVPTDFSMKILCSAAKIGGVIGKGGFNVKQVQQETGASIHVEDVSAELDERVIRVSSIEAPWNPRSQTIDAILLLHNKTSEFSDKGTVTTRLLVPSSKVGCILGQGGHVINEMRRRTQADIRVYSKEDKPKCAAEDEELVQISGNPGVAKDALAEISSRLRSRCLRDAKNAGEPAPVRPHTGYGHPGKVHGGPPPLSGSNSIGIDSPGAYNHYKGHGREYDELSSYPIHPSATGYLNDRRGVELKMPNNAMGSVMHSGRSDTSNFAGARMKHQDPMSTSSESYIDSRYQHFNNAETMHSSFIAAGGPSNNHQHGSYQDYGHNYNPQHGSYLHANDGDQYNSRGKYDSYSEFGSRGDQYNNPQHASYNDINSQPPAYPNNNASRHPYQNVTQQQPPHQNYQSVTTPQAPYHNTSAPNSYQY